MGKLVSSNNKNWLIRPIYTCRLKNMQTCGVQLQGFHTEGTNTYTRTINRWIICWHNHNTFLTHHKEIFGFGLWLSLLNLYWTWECNNTWTIVFLPLLCLGRFISRLWNYFRMDSSWNSTRFLNKKYQVNIFNHW